MSGDGDDDGATNVFGEVLAADWGRWRVSHPVRPYAPAAGGIRDSKESKPTKENGARWTTYRNLQQKSLKVQQEWLYVPYATLVGGPGSPAATWLKICTGRSLVALRPRSASTILPCLSLEGHRLCEAIVVTCLP